MTFHDVIFKTGSLLSGSEIKKRKAWQDSEAYYMCHSFLQPITSLLYYSLCCSTQLYTWRQKVIWIRKYSVNKGATLKYQPWTWKILCFGYIHPFLMSKSINSTPAIQGIWNFWNSVGPFSFTTPRFLLFGVSLCQAKQSTVGEGMTILCVEMNTVLMLPVGWCL